VDDETSTSERVSFSTPAALPAFSAVRDRALDVLPLGARQHQLGGSCVYVLQSNVMHSHLALAMPRPSRRCTYWMLQRQL